MAGNLTVENLTRAIDASDMQGLFGLERRSEARPSGAPATPGVAESGSFLQMLQNSMEKVNLDQHQADHAVKELVAGRTKNIHETLLTIERADMSLKMAMQVRNKILDAYREIMRMQV